MKKTLLSLFFLTILLTGCSSDDDSNSMNPIDSIAALDAVCTGPINQSEIIGTWSLTNLRSEVDVETTINGTSTTSNQAANFVSSTVVFVFNPDGTFTVSGQTIVEDSIEGINVGTRVLSPSDTGFYSIEANDVFAFNNLASGSDTDSAIFTIRRLDDTNFCMTAVINDVLGDVASGFSSVTIGTSTLAFTRQ